MDTKKLILAIALSIIVISLYQYFFMPKPAEVPKGKPIQQQALPPGEAQTSEPGKTGSEKRDLSDIFAEKKKEEVAETASVALVDQDLKGDIKKDYVVETDLFTAVFTNQGAGLRSFILKKYLDDTKQPLDLVSKKVEEFGLYPFYFSPFEGDQLFKDLNQALFIASQPPQLDIKGDGTQELTFKYSDKENNFSAVKRFVFSGNSYVIKLQTEVLKDGKRLDAPYVFGPELENNIDKKARMMQNVFKIGAYNGDDIVSVKFASIKTQKLNTDSDMEIAKGSIGGFFYWSAYQTTYFTAMFKTDTRDSQLNYYIIKKQTGAGKERVIDLFSYMIVGNPTQVYLGPKDEEVLSTVEDVFKDATEVVEYGWFGSIAKLMLKGVNIANRIVPNYGWAIILFTLFLKVILFPLTYSSSVSMAKMQTLQPKMKAIKKKYKNQKDPEQRKAMNVEMMALYKQEKVNPAGGCLPMLLQLPILWGLFRMLAVSINVRHEPWILWIKDLSLKDPIYILPILMGITQIIVQKMSPTSGAEGAQKKMMYLMPVLITFFVMNLPSGLTLYWFVSNLLQIGQQYIINEKIFKQKKDEERARKMAKKKGKGPKK